MANRYWVGGTGDWDGTAGTKWATTSGGAGGSAVPTSADTVFFDANSGANTVTIGAGTAICSTLTMTGFTGTLAFGTNSIDIAGTGTIYTGATTFTVTGTPLILCTNSSATARTINAGAVTETNSISFDITAGSGSITTTASTNYKNLTFSGIFTGTLNNNTRTLYGNLTIKSGMTVNAGGNTTTFAATSGTQTITSAGLNLNFPITINATGATVQLQDALTVGTATGRTITLTSGTFDLNNNNVTIFGSFVGTGSTTRTIAFGTGQFYLTQNTGTIWSVTGSNLTITGTDPTVSATGLTPTGRTVVHIPTTVSQALSINFNVTSGSDGFGFGGGTQLFNNLDFTGFSGAIGNAGLSGGASFNIYGNLTMGTGMTRNSSGSDTYRGTGTQLITSNGVIFDQPIGLSGTGTYSLQDAFVTGATRNISFNSGTLQTNGYSLTCGTFSYNNSTTKALNLGTSTITITGGSNASGFAGSNAGTTYTSVTSSTIVFTTTGTAAFSGGQGTAAGNQFGTVTMSGLGGTLFLGTNTGATVARCITLSNTVQPCTITNACTTGFTVTNFNVSGTAGNLVTFNSNTAGTARTINQASGTVNAYYLNIQDSTASGGAVWNAYDSTNSGNNTGWNFLTANSGNFLLMFG
jgi:hypothetical protein